MHSAFQVTRIKVECFRDECFVQARRVNAKNFFAELKRRNVYKVAIAYAVVAWLLMQIATQVFPFLEIPNWAIRLVIMLIVIGFPIAVVIAWAFELTPEGIKRTEDVDLNKSIRRKTGRKLDFFIIAVLLLVIGFLLFQRLHHNVSPPRRQCAALGEPCAGERPVNRRLARAKGIAAQDGPIRPVGNCVDYRRGRICSIEHEWHPDPKTLAIPHQPTATETTQAPQATRTESMAETSPETEK
jgi:hypothetical protein